MAPYIGLMRGMSRRDIQIVVTFLNEVMEEAEESETVPMTNAESQPAPNIPWPSHRPLPPLCRGRGLNSRSPMRDSVRWRKQSRIVLMLAQELNISEEEALDRFYNSRTYTFFADPSRGLQAMSDRYIVDEILQEG